MSLELYCQALDFISYSEIEEVRLLGGEPTLHPNFESFVNKALSKDLKVVVFSNGLMSEDKLWHIKGLSSDRLSVLINTIVPDETNTHEVMKQRYALKHLGPMASLGINIFSPGIRFEFLLDLIREFDLSPFIRLGLAHPCTNTSNHFLHPRHYQTIGRKLLKLFKKAAESEINVDMDCGFVPCMFPENEQEFIKKIAPDIGQRCNPILDILPNGRIISCYPLANIADTPLTSNTHETDLRTKFEKKFAPFRKLGIYPECSDCLYRKSSQCVGGCLSAAMMRLNRNSQNSRHPKIYLKKKQQTHSHIINPRNPDDRKESIQKPAEIWSIPYIDQPLSFWNDINAVFGQEILEVYFPMPGISVGSGRPLQPAKMLGEFLKNMPLKGSVLVNPILLKAPVNEIADNIISAAKKLKDKHGINSITVSDLNLAIRIKEALPDISITGSILMDIVSPNQALLLSGICQTLVPSSRIMRNIPALKAIREAFTGNIRLMVNEACLPHCPFRVQHFYEMGVLGHSLPKSLCDNTLKSHPWMRLTGAWVLPQHLHLYNGIYDELKLAGRATLKDPDEYFQVLKAYIHKQPLTPDKIGGGPASPLEPLEIKESFFSETLHCGHQCNTCTICKDYYFNKKSPGKSPKLFKKIHPDLPIFQIQSKNSCLLYTPGQSKSVSDKDADRVEAYYNKKSLEKTTAVNVADLMYKKAKEAVENYQKWGKTPFEPECLTVYPSNSCNLSCQYCYSHEKEKKQKQDNKFFDEETLKAASFLVAENCNRKKIPFYLVLHGGGEPTYSFERVMHIEKLTRKIAEQFDLEWISYIATNGVLSEEKAYWLANHFNRIGISCDGPPDIQDQQRPLHDGSPSSSYIENTANILKTIGKPVNIRATITPETMERQVAIVSYFCKKLGASTIRFEPAYRFLQKNGNRFSAKKAETFVKHFLIAQEKAQVFGCQLSMSGIHLNEFHGPYCDVLRNVLRLTSDGTALSCYLYSDNEGHTIPRFQIGRLDKNLGKFSLNSELIESHRKLAVKIPEKCVGCINIFHCVRACPERCQVLSKEQQGFYDLKAESFRCKVYQLLSTNWILKNSEQINLKKKDVKLSSYFANLPSSINKAAIERQYAAINGKYIFENQDMPSPIWVREGFNHYENKLWDNLTQKISMSECSDPMSIYIHIPFCEQNCGFCDCYSFPLRKNKIKRETKFLKALLSEIEFWAQIQPLSKRPVTTIHFGGGTPNCITPDNFERILNHFNKFFSLAPETELAIETTSTLIAKKNLILLNEWGISRIHVGVQTLNDKLREWLGRRDTAKEVIEKISFALDMGFITTIDILYGLPQQSFLDMENTLQEFIKINTPGFSLYRLNISRRNKWFFNQTNNFKPDTLFDYLNFQMADQILTNSGYSKNYYNHYSLPEDQNLYFTYPQRGEDLLALGPTADGVFGSYHYRHNGYKNYMKENRSNRPSLQGGIETSVEEQKKAPAILGLLKGSLKKKTAYTLQMVNLIDHWIKLGCLEDRDDEFYLTGNGSWFIQKMLLQL